MNLEKIKVNKKLLENQKKIYEKYFPEILMELKGINSVLQINEEQLLFFFLAGELNWFRRLYLPKEDFHERIKGCTIFGFKNQDGFFVGRNYDWLKATEEKFKIYKVVNQTKNSYLAITDMGVYAPKSDSQYLFYNEDDIINDKGLFIGLNFALAYKWAYGLRPAHMMKLIAENCHSVDEAVEMLKKVPLCYPKFFFIADRAGKMVVVEHDSKNIKIREPDNNLLIMTNHFVDQDLHNEDKILIKYKKHNTQLRYEEVCQKLDARKDNFVFSDIIEILGDKKSHACQDKYGIRTIWSLSLEMKRRKYFLFHDLFGKRKKINLFFG